MKICAWRALIVEHRFGKEADGVYEKDGSLRVLGSLEEDVVEDLIKDRITESLPLDHEVVRLTIVIDDEHEAES